MPALKNVWSKDQEISYLDCSFRESPYVFSEQGEIISCSDDFCLEQYQKGKTGEFIIRHRSTKKNAGYLFAYVLSYPEIELKKGLLIDNPFVRKEYRGRGLSLWAYDNLISHYNLPLVSSQTQTVSIFRSVWIPLSQRKRITAYNTQNKNTIFPWAEKHMEITHLNNDKDWLLVYK